MLPPAHRVRSSQEFSAVLRHGVRGSARGPAGASGARGRQPLLTVHLLPADPGDPRTAATPARAGLVVSKAVGGSVVRHRTSRRLRHLLAPHLVGPDADVPAGTALVVRAAPAAGTADSAALRESLDGALRVALDRATRAGSDR